MTGQLTGADYDYQTDKTYTYDANGNRTNTGYTTDDANQLTCDGTYTYQYDSEGNRTARFVDNDTSGTLTTGDTDITEYQWDHRNRLTSVTNRASYGGATTQVVDYIYDTRNRLVGKILDPDGAGEEGTSEEYYAYEENLPSPAYGRGAGGEGDQILLRFDGSETSDLVDRYLWAPAVDLLLSDEKLTGPSTPGTIYWTLGDNLNTVRDIALYNSGNDTTTIQNHRVYNAYGKLTSESNSAVNLLFGFTGRLFDESTGLQNNLNRWYDPLVGRWMSEDPKGFAAGDQNLYRYVNNGPTNATDPSGLLVSGASGPGTRYIHPSTTPSPTPGTISVTTSNSVEPYYPNVHATTTGQYYTQTMLESNFKNSIFWEDYGFGNGLYDKKGYADWVVERVYFANAKPYTVCNGQVIAHLRKMDVKRHCWQWVYLMRLAGQEKAEEQIHKNMAAIYGKLAGGLGGLSSLLGLEAMGGCSASVSTSLITVGGKVIPALDDGLAGLGALIKSAGMTVKTVTTCVKWAKVASVGGFVAGLIAMGVFTELQNEELTAANRAEAAAESLQQWAHAIPNDGYLRTTLITTPWYESSDPSRPLPPGWNNDSGTLILEPS